MYQGSSLNYFVIFLLVLNDCNFILPIDWNSDIVPNQAELKAQNNDALSKYFGTDINNLEIFRSYEIMQKLVGEYKDVPLEKQKNHNYEEMTSWLKDLANRFPHITYLYSIGQSIQKRQLWVLVVARNPREHEILRPEFKYVANMHGNEVTGREALLYLAYILCENYGSNQYLTRMVNETRIHLMPSMNPDGYEMDRPGDRIGYLGRSNADNVDLNRNFPARYPMHKEASGGMTTEPETKAVMQWMTEYPFVLSANLHGGSLVANYPYDDSDTGADGIYTASADDKLFVQLAFQYARAHTNMWLSGRRCGLNDNGDTFLHGITNGAGWYHLSGGMQDWQYVHTNALEITVEMGCFKFPYDDMIPTLWKQHRFSLLSFMESVHSGVKGVVHDATGEKPISGAEITIIKGGKGKALTTSLNGEYWRLLPPGEYSLQVSHKNFKPYQFDITIDSGPAKVVNVSLKGMECDGEDIPKLQLFVRGKGPLNLLLVGFDSAAKGLLTRLVNHSCPMDEKKRSKLAYMLLENVRLHIVTEYTQTDQLLQYMRNINADSLLIFSAGPAHSTIFNAGENTPRLFNQDKFDQSLKKVFSSQEQFYNMDSKTANSFSPINSRKKVLRPNCEDRLGQTKTAAIIDEMRLGRIFELGIGIGCDSANFSSKEDIMTTGKMDAALDAIIEVMLNISKQDKVLEFSVVPSIAPTDHFTPAEVQTVTHYGYDRLDQSSSCSAKLIEMDGLKLRSLGSHNGPHTLILSVEMKTEALVYHLGARLCGQGPVEGLTTTPTIIDEEMRQVQRILEYSTIVLAPDIPHTQLNCHDYFTISPFISLITQIINLVPEIDFVIVLGTGGIKIRFIDVRRPGNDLGMTNNGTLIMSQPPSAELDENDQIKLPDLPKGNWTSTPQALAQLYIDGHEQMRQNKRDMCATNRPSTPVLDEFHWSAGRDKWTSAPDALLVQVGCCYEGQGISHLFEENRRSLFSILERRLQGVSGVIREMSGDRLSGVNVSVWPIQKDHNIILETTKTTKTTKNGHYNLALEPGTYRAMIMADGYDPMSSTFTVSFGQSTVKHFALHRPFTMSVERSIVAALIALTMLSISFCCLCRSMRRSKTKKSLAATQVKVNERRKDGFERVPLRDYHSENDSDDSDEEEVLDTRRMAMPV
uniref:Peptidase M14 carboxypeptidase A domain-containing protein n=1 Tax=Meloidogyne incognita TaxID=6306 RepID=A0A914L0K0_MELIC